MATRCTQSRPDTVALARRLTRARSDGTIVAPHYAKSIRFRATCDGTLIDHDLTGLVWIAERITRAWHGWFPAHRRVFRASNPPAFKRKTGDTGKVDYMEVRKWTARQFWRCW